MEFFDSSKKPIDREKQGYSVTILIDPEGTRKYFSLGWYDFDSNIWRLSTDLFSDVKQSKSKNLRWAYLPLAELDGIKL